ncbi:MAG: histidine ammonia-lyase [Planctomycetota bacterium]|nr:MAG: histidine ammonia-lyase [Planctomycetota bacterium]
MTPNADAQVLRLSGEGLTLSDLQPVLEGPVPRLDLSEDAWSRCAASREVVEEVVRTGRTVYGVNTGFGKLAGVAIEADKLGQLQRNLILSHATGVGCPLPVEISRLMILLRVQALAKGHSGVRRELLERLLLHFNEGLIPVIPEQGSVGASGDLAPLAHVALTLLGEGDVWFEGRPVPTAERFAALGLKPFELSAKEGLALINGTQCMTAIGVHALLIGGRVLKSADIACALSLEALRGSCQPYQPKVHQARGQLGQALVARNLLALLEDSEVIPSHKDCGKVQDAYSLRCVPQVHGAARDAFAFVQGVLEREINAATDNPLVFADGDVISAGNFHGQPVSQALDFLGISIATLANISERRIENLVNPDLSGLSPFLAPNPGLNSGLMIPQVVAASLASENKSLAHPASVDTIPTSANREDHVSMGVTAARHARDIVNNTAKVLGIELISGAQGLHFDHSIKAGRGVEAAFAVVREHIPPLGEDRYLAPDLAVAEEIVRSGELLRRVEQELGCEL